MERERNHRKQTELETERYEQRERIPEKQIRLMEKNGEKLNTKKSPRK